MEWKYDKAGRAYCYIDGRKIYRNRYVHEHKIGPIPRGFEVHHINLNRADDRPDNLVALHPDEHRQTHDENPFTYICQRCGGAFEQTRGRPRSYCPGCHPAVRRDYGKKADSKRRSIERQCKLCGATFESRNGELCSQRCVNLWRHGHRP